MKVLIMVHTVDLSYELQIGDAATNAYRRQLHRMDSRFPRKGPMTEKEADRLRAYINERKIGKQDYSSAPVSLSWSREKGFY